MSVPGCKECTMAGNAPLTSIPWSSAASFLNTNWKHVFVKYQFVIKIWKHMKLGLQGRISLTDMSLFSGLNLILWISRLSISLFVKLATEVLMPHNQQVCNVFLYYCTWHVNKSSSNFYHAWSLCNSKLKTCWHSMSKVKFIESHYLAIHTLFHKVTQ